MNSRHLELKKNPKLFTSGSQKLPIDFLGNIAYTHLDHKLTVRVSA